MAHAPPPSFFAAPPSQLHFAFTAYAVLSYLYVRPSLEHALVRDQQATAVSLHLPPLARTLSASLLPQRAPPKPAPSRKRKEVPSAAPPELSSASGGKGKARKQRIVPAESDESDVDGGSAGDDDAEEDDDVFEVAKPARGRGTSSRQGGSSSDGRGGGAGAHAGTSNLNAGMKSGAEVVVLE